MRNAVILPVHNPEDSFFDYVVELSLTGFKDIIIVNNGSSKNHNYLFEYLSVLSYCTVISNGYTKDYACSLKTAIQFIDDNMPYIEGVIAVDITKEYTVDDIVKLSVHITKHPSSLALGVRDIDENHSKSRLFSKALSLFHGINLKDIHTGIRAFTKDMFQMVLRLDGCHDRFWLDMLIHSKKESHAILAISLESTYTMDIETYDIKDSAKILFHLVRVALNYAWSSIICASIDLTLFALLTVLFMPYFDKYTAVAISAFAARGVSSVVNFSINRKIFSSAGTTLFGTCIRYYTLLSIQLSISTFFLNFLGDFILINNVILKALIDIVLAVISYQFQLRWVFKKHDERRNIVV